MSTRVGNLLGATLDDAAKTAAHVGILVSSSIGVLNGYFKDYRILNLDSYCLLLEVGGATYLMKTRRLSNS